MHGHPNQRKVLEGSQTRGGRGRVEGAVKLHPSAAKHHRIRMASELGFRKRCEGQLTLAGRDAYV